MWLDAWGRTGEASGVRRASPETHRRRPEAALLVRVLWQLVSCRTSVAPW